MTNQLAHRPLMGPPDEYVSIPEIEYLLAVGGIDHVVLAGIPLVSLDGLRDYVRRHSGPALPDQKHQPALIPAEDPDLTQAS